MPDSEIAGLRAELLRRYGSDEQLLLDIIQLFLEDLPDMVEKIREALVSGESEPLARSAHSLKGAVSNFDREDAWKKVAELEATARDGNFQKAAEQFPLVKEAMGILGARLRQLSEEKRQ